MAIPKSTAYGVSYQGVLQFKGNKHDMQLIAKANGGSKKGWQLWVTDQLPGSVMTPPEVIARESLTARD